MCMDVYFRIAWNVYIHIRWNAYIYIYIYIRIALQPVADSALMDLVSGGGPAVRGQIRGDDARTPHVMWREVGLPRDSYTVVL